jgi:hypothetical protein
MSAPRPTSNRKIRTCLEFVQQDTFLLYARVKIKLLLWVGSDEKMTEFVVSTFFV